MDREHFENNPRSYAMMLVENQIVDPKNMVRDLLNFLDRSEVQDFLERNELSPQDDEEE